ncbi:Cro/Cl family transcriptional regulator [Shigella sonnei]|nr:Cro/Cl family transcriptional regulator [Shigella sonnei]EFV9547693.1 Cro/Cl family transcriptional regulator [Shigella sonnei]
MTKSDVFKFYAGGQVRGATTIVASALGKTQAAVHKWPEVLPESVQYEIEVKTNYQLQSKFTRDRLSEER